MNRESRIRPMVEADAEVVAELATELGYPNEIDAIRRRIRPIGEADLLLVATDGSDKPVGFIQAHRVCIIEVGFRVEILGTSGVINCASEGNRADVNRGSGTLGKEDRR